MSRPSLLARGLTLCGLSCLSLTLSAGSAHASTHSYAQGWWQYFYNCSGGRCTQAWSKKQRKRKKQRDRCTRDRHCRDGKSSTLDWCFAGRCVHSERDHSSCRSERPRFCYRDAHCGDHDSSTVDWCYKMLCHHAPRDGADSCLPDQGQPPASECRRDRDCRDGKRSTIDWCHEGECVHSKRKDPECLGEQEEYCCKDRHCNDHDPDTVDWCHNSTCHHAPRDGGGSCEPADECDPADCPQDDNECTFASCKDNACAQENRPEGTRCTGGICNAQGECVRQ